MKPPHYNFGPKNSNESICGNVLKHDNKTSSPHYNFGPKNSNESICGNVLKPDNKTSLDRVVSLELNHIEVL